MASSKTMFNYFSKVTAKAGSVEEDTRKLAPIFNKQHVDEFQSRRETFDSELVNSESRDIQENYLSLLKTGQHQPYKVVKKARGPLRSRLLQFTEDVRPPYFGTWQKKSKLVTGRRPCGQDIEVFDYEVDSEAEWDIGGPGESLKGDDSEDDEEMDDYEIDMKTFVPHGYVSDDEVNSDNEENPANRSIEEDCDIENNSDSDIKVVYTKVNRTEQQQVTPQQQPKQTPKMDLKPIILGLNFDDNSSLSETKARFLRAFQGVSCG